MNLCHKMLLFMFLMLIFLSACRDQTIKEQIYHHLEEAVQLEQEFAKQQEIINNLERQEQELYHEIISLSMKEKHKIDELSQQALEIIGERMIQIDIEKDSIEASKAEFMKIKPLIEQLEDQALATKAKDMYDVMSSRYSTYEQLYLAYRHSLELEQKLYELLQDEQSPQEQLTDLIESINQQYQLIIDHNEQFNTDTLTYNDIKREFYELADLQIEY